MDNTVLDTNENEATLSDAQIRQEIAELAGDNIIPEPGNTEGEIINGDDEDEDEGDGWL